MKKEDVQEHIIIIIWWGANLPISSVNTNMSAKARDEKLKLIKLIQMCKRADPTVN